MVRAHQRALGCAAQVVKYNIQHAYHAQCMHDMYITTAIKGG